MPHLVDPRLLQAFVAVAETGTVTAAGERLAYSQARVSQHLHMLEAIAGDRLFRRTRAGMELAKSSPLRWVWVVLIGILIIAAAAAWVYCRTKGYRGFEGHIEAVKGPFGIKIGVKIGCY